MTRWISKLSTPDRNALEYILGADPKTYGCRLCGDPSVTPFVIDAIVKEYTGTVTITVGCQKSHKIATKTIPFKEFAFIRQQQGGADETGK